MVSTALNLYASAVAQHGNSMPTSMASTALNLFASTQYGKYYPPVWQVLPSTPVLAHSMVSTALNLFANAQHGKYCPQPLC